jgi:uncharacterized glyoxalase superfamily protein PhnB
MIIPSLTYNDMPLAMAELHDVYGFEIVWQGDETAEIRWHGGVAVAQLDQPDLLHGTHVGHGWTYVHVEDPDEHYARALTNGASVTGEPHSTPDGLQRGYSAHDREGNLWTFALYRFGQ